VDVRVTGLAGKMPSKFMQAPLSVTAAATITRFMKSSFPKEQDGCLLVDANLSDWKWEYLEDNYMNNKRDTSGQNVLGFVRLIARMQTEEEFPLNAMPPAEDWTATLSELIVAARKLTESAKRPPRRIADPDGQNKSRAEWAKYALVAFQSQTGTDNEDAVKDLLCDLMHYCQQTDGENFEASLDAARRHYLAETTPEKRPRR
jgi:hypothetical protein